jgi:hypothetical protein
MSQPAASDQDPRVIFLVGPAHSGKTEVAAAFRKLRRTLVVRRAYYWRDSYGAHGLLQDTDSLSMCLNELASDQLLRTAGVDRELLGQVAATACDSYGSLFLAATVEAARNLADMPGRPERLVIQIGGLESLGALVLADLPQARMVHLIRDPRRYFGSTVSGIRLGSLGWRLASWSSSASAAIRNSGEVPGRYRVVRGEDLIARPGRVSELLSSLAGTDVDLAGVSASLREKGSPLSTHRTRIVEGLVGSQLEALGYPLDRSRRRDIRSVPWVDSGAYHVRTRFALRPGTPV